MGWDVNLDDHVGFNAAIKTIYEMSEQHHLLMRSRCRDLALNYIGDTGSLELLKGLYKT